MKRSLPGTPQSLQRLLSLPPRVLLRKVWRKAGKTAALWYRRRQDARQATYAALSPRWPGKLYQYFQPLALDLLEPQAEKIQALTSYYLEHRYDLLGSGWVRVRYGMKCRGLEGQRYEMGREVRPDLRGHWLAGLVTPANLSESQRIWGMIRGAYQPIDWQLDFKSGYRWSGRTWYRDILYGHALGVDIKVLWELGRMQHLPQLAWAYALSRSGRTGLAPPELYPREFCHQVLDFLATNPPRFGANWHCTMDVSIRVVNWLVTYDLFRAYGAAFAEEFQEVFGRSIYEHGRHMRENLEWDPELRGNHYLANIVGLLFVAAYLPGSRPIDAWLGFAVQELIREVNHQFYADGANFEASTCYHRLAAEMVIYGTALVLGLPPEKRAVLQEMLEAPGAPGAEAPGTVPDKFFPFPGWYLTRLEKMAEFTRDITKPDGRVPQIGDNDSGRFLKLLPVHQALTVAEARSRYGHLTDYADLPDDAAYWDEDHLDHRHLVAAVNGLWGRRDLADFAAVMQAETELVHGLAAGICIPSYRPPQAPGAAATERIGTAADFHGLREQLQQDPGLRRQEYVIHLGDPGILADLHLWAYPDFGLYLVKSPRLYLAMHCGPIGQNGNGGHAHNDQLSLELTVDGQDRLRDPGTYLYTPLPHRRNQYRSVQAHWGPRFGQAEPNSLDLGLFQLGNEAAATCLYFGEQGFIGRYGSDRAEVYRVLALAEGEIQLTDYSRGTQPAPIMRFDRASSPVAFSPGYGLLRVSE
jgi:hypothetical protein